MAFNLRLPDFLRKARWKVKVRDRESREPPHVTIIRGTKAWRISLRTGEFMDDEPDPDEVPLELLEFVEDETTWQRLCAAWDELYPENPVAGDETRNDGD